MKAETYKYDEFLNHFQAMLYVREYETAHLDYSSLEKAFYVNGDYSTEANLFRIIDYFTQLGYTEEERIYKASRLMILLMYLSKHFNYFDKQRFVVIGAKDGPSLVSEPLLRALHEHFCGAKLPNNINPDKIVERAQEFKAKYEENEKTPPD